MTEEEFEAASKAYYKWRKALSKPPNEIDTYEAAFSAALEFKRADFHRRVRFNIEEQGFNLLVCKGDHEKSEGCKYEEYTLSQNAEVERERSAKLFAALEHVRAYIIACGSQGTAGVVDESAIYSICEKAIAEYEVGRE